MYSGMAKGTSLAETNEKIKPIALSYAGHQVSVSKKSIKSFLF